MSLFVCKLLRKEEQSSRALATKVDDNICLLPIPLLLSREVEPLEESREVKLDGFSIREFDKLSFRVKLDIVRNLDWTEGT